MALLDRCPFRGALPGVHALYVLVQDVTQTSRAGKRHHKPPDDDMGDGARCGNVVHSVGGECQFHDAVTVGDAANVISEDLGCVRVVDQRRRVGHVAPLVV